MINHVATTKLEIPSQANREERVSSPISAMASEILSASSQAVSDKNLAGHVKSRIDPSQQEVTHKQQAVYDMLLNHRNSAKSSLGQSLDKIQGRVDSLPSRHHWNFVKTIINIINSMVDAVKSYFSSDAKKEFIIGNCLEQFYNHVAPFMNSADKVGIVVGMALMKFEDEAVSMFREMLRDKDPEAIKGLIDDFYKVLHQKINPEQGQSAIDPSQSERAHTRQTKDENFSDNFLKVGSVLISALQKASNQPTICSEELLKIEETLCPPACMKIYIRSADGTIREGKLGDEPLEGELRFESYPSIRQDIERDRVVFNGQLCESLEGLIDCLLKEGVPRERIGTMVSLFAQNTSNSLMGIMMETGQIFDVQFRAHELHYDSNTGECIFRNRCSFRHYTFEMDSSEDAPPPWIKDSQDSKSVQGVFTMDLELRANLLSMDSNSTIMKSRVSIFETLPDSQFHFPAAQSENMMKVISDRLNLGAHPMSPPERKAIAEQVKSMEEQVHQMQGLLKEIEDSAAYVKRLAGSVRGLQVNSDWELQNSQRGGGRVRARRQTVASQIRNRQEKVLPLINKLSNLLVEFDKTRFIANEHRFKDVKHLQKAIKDASANLVKHQENLEKFKNLKLSEVKNDPSGKELMDWAKQMLDLKLESLKRRI